MASTLSFFILVLSLTINVKTQFFDIFQPWNQQHYVTQKPNRQITNAPIRSPIAQLEPKNERRKHKNNPGTNTNENRSEIDFVSLVDVQNKEDATKQFYKPKNTTTKAWKSINTHESQSGYDPDSISFDYQNGEARKNKRRPAYETEQINYNVFTLKPIFPEITIKPPFRIGNHRTEAAYSNVHTTKAPNFGSNRRDNAFNPRVTERPNRDQYTTKKQNTNNNRRPENNNYRPESNYNTNFNTERPNYDQYTTKKQNTNNNRRPENNNYRPESNYNTNLNTERPNYDQYTTKKQNTNNNRRPENNNYRPESNYNTNSNTERPNYDQYTTKKQNTNNNRRPENNNYRPESNYNTNLNTERPNYDQYTTKKQNNYNNQPPSYTTQNPYNIRPGIVRPAINDNRAPITNRPTTKLPEAQVSDNPEVITGPNEDYFSESEKRRYLEMIERLCDKHKSLQVNQLQAIPLLPSPDPVKVNISRCLPVNVPLVVGGRVASIQEFPHMSLLGWRRLSGVGYSWKCGGSLISDNFVLTAAHCAYQDRDNSVIPGPPRVVQLGSSFLDDPGAIVMKVSSVIRHPLYKLPKSYHDLAMLKLDSKVSFSERIKPACIGVAPPPGEPVVATGWGRTEFGGEQSEELRSVSVNVWEMRDCQNILGTSRKLPEGPSRDSQICAGEAAGGKDTCQGDSGGPIQIQDGCTWRVVAVTSLGKSCGAAQTPGLYAVAKPVFIAATMFGH